MLFSLIIFEAKSVEALTSSTVTIFLAMSLKQIPKVDIPAYASNIIGFSKLSRIYFFINSKMLFAVYGLT